MSASVPGGTAWDRGTGEAYRTFAQQVKREPCAFSTRKVSWLREAFAMECRVRSLPQLRIVHRARPPMLSNISSEAVWAWSLFRRLSPQRRDQISNLMAAWLRVESPAAAEVDATQTSGQNR